MAHRDDSIYATDPSAGPRFLQSLVRVMAVQVVTLALLWLLQQHYSG